MYYRNIARATGIHFAFDLTTLPAVAEDALTRAIIRKDDRVLIRKTKDPYDNEFYR